MTIKEHVSTKTARKLLGVTTQTLRNWDKSGKIKTIRSASGARLYDLSMIQDIDHLNFKRKIAYCRVSSSKQTDDLNRQKLFFQTSYPEYEVIEDIASGINWKRKGLLKILDMTIQNKVDEIIIAHKDRLCRFGFELLEWIFQKHNVTVNILDHDEHSSPETELADDILSIVHVFSCRQMGRRRYKHSETEPPICS